MAGKGYVFTKTSQMASIGVIFTSAYHTKQFNPWPNSSLSQSCGELQPAVCLPRGYAAIWRRPVHPWMSDKPQKQATAKVAWATFSMSFLTQVLHPLYQLVKQEAKWKWLVATVPVIAHYNADKLIWLCCDALPKGVRAYLMHIIDG